MNPRTLSTDTVETFFSIVEALFGNPTLLVALRGWRVLQWEQAKRLDPLRVYGWRTAARPKYLHHRLDGAVNYKPRSLLPNEQRPPSAPALRSPWLTIRRFFVDADASAVNKTALLADENADEQ